MLVVNTSSKERCRGEMLHLLEDNDDYMKHWNGIEETSQSFRKMLEKK